MTHLFRCLLVGSKALRQKNLACLRVREKGVLFADRNQFVDELFNLGILFVASGILIVSFHPLSPDGVIFAYSSSVSHSLTGLVSDTLTT